MFLFWFYKHFRLTAIFLFLHCCRHRRAILLQPASARTILACQQRLRFDGLGTVQFENLNNKHLFYKQQLEVGAPAMRSKRYMVFQASRWIQVAPKPSQDSPKMAPAWPKMAPSWTQVAPKRTIWLHRGSATAILAFKQGMRVLCSVNNAI